MQVMMQSCSRFWMGAVVAMILCGTGAAAEAPMRVEVWRRGDDRLTTSLRDAIEKAFISSSNFALAGVDNEATVGTLVVTIPDHVAWREKRGRTRIIYRVEFSTKDDRLIFETQGCCWASSVKKCAKEVLQDAKIAAKTVLFEMEVGPPAIYETERTRDGKDQ